MLLQIKPALSSAPRIIFVLFMLVNGWIITILLHHLVRSKPALSIIFTHNTVITGVELNLVITLMIEMKTFGYLILWMILQMRPVFVKYDRNVFEFIELSTYEYCISIYTIYEWYLKKAFASETLAAASWPVDLVTPEIHLLV